MKHIIEKMQSEQSQIKEWFEHMHRNPELSMKEENTAQYLADVLSPWGYEIEKGVGKYGIVASLKVGESKKAIGLRADFDALPIQEVNELSYKSKLPGISHLCGHDGHSTMLLAAGKYLSETQNFNGTVRLIFQPGEETMEGGPAMIEDGLFERFPVDSVYGMHNMPGLALGTFYFADGDVMAAVDNWEIEITGKGGHGSMPELSIDPVVAGSSLVMALQTIVSRNMNPAHSAVVTVGAFQSGNAGNVIAQSAVLRLSIRTKTDADRKMVLDKIKTLTRTQAEGFGCSYEIREGIPGAVLVNTKAETLKAYEIANAAFGEDRTIYPGPTFLGSEDFAFMLQKRPGTYCFIGNGDTPMVHHPEYVLNQDILPRGAAYWVALVEGILK